MNKKFAPLWLSGLLVVAISLVFFVAQGYENSHVAVEIEESPQKISLPVEKTLPEKVEQTNIASANETFRHFRQWLEGATSAPNADWVAEGVILAKARHDHMADLIKTNPQTALRRAVSLKEYASLPPEVAQWVEKPFSSQADILILPNEADPAGKTPGNFDETNISLTLRESGSQSYTLYRYGNRANILSKDGIATQGITLDGLAAIEDAALVVVKTEDRDFIQTNFPSVGSSVQDFFTGEAIHGNPVIALAGGQVFHFASEANVEKLNSQLGQLEAKTGPKTGSQILFQAAPISGAPAEGSSVTVEETPLASQLDALLAAPNPWTEAKKKVFFIRVDFSDYPGEPVTQATLSNALNNSVSMQIKNMSRNKTWLEAEVSSQVVRMPQPGSYYAPGENTQLHDDAQAAFNALGTGVDLSDYDIIGVYFPDIGMGTSFTYAGLASLGGGRQWLQNYYSSGVVVHEFGHNYGLGHASFWETSNASVVGTGSSEEYGDKYDIMGGGGVTEGYFHPQGLSKLNWLESTQWTDITASGLYRVYRFDDVAASGNQGLRIERTVGGNNDGYYWLGHRQNYDSNNWLENGVYLIWQQPGYTRSWLVDTTPGSFADNSDDKNDAGVVLGQTYSDTSANIHITPLAKGGSSPGEWIDVQVNIGAFAGNAVPSVSISEGETAAARSEITFTANASDPDGDSLAYSWDFGDGVIHESAASVHHAWVVGGTYTVQLTVSDMKGGTATDQITVTVNDPLNTWTQRTSGSTQHLKDVATDGSKLVTVASAGEILTSTDGAVWDKQDLGGNVRLYGVSFANGLWVAVGNDYSFSIPGWVGVIYTSADAVTWTKRYTSDSASSSFNKVAYGNGAWVAVADNGIIFRSIDGVTWASQTSGTANNVNDVAFGNGVFVAMAGGSNGLVSVVLTSTDGIAWTDRSDGAGTGQAFWYVSYLNDRFIGDGFYTGLRYSTNDGVSFQKANQPTSYAFPATAYGNGVYFGAGVDRAPSPDIDQNVISVDGVSWSVLQASSQSDRNAAVFFNNTFITVGNDGTIYQSEPLSSSVTDTTPEAFNFIDQTAVEPGAGITSAAISISGINTATAISITGGEYSINDGTFTSTTGTVNNGDSVKVRHTSSTSFGAQTDTVLTIGGVSDTFSSTTRGADTIPDAFSFTDQAGVDPGIVITSDAIAVTGIDSAASITVSGGEYSINEGTFTSVAGTVNNGDSVKVRHTSSANLGTQTDTVLMIGGVSDTFSSTTRSDTRTTDTMPDAFSFTDQRDVEPGAEITSSAISVSGINTAAAISITGGEYCINAGAFTSTAGTVNNGDAVKVRHTASSSFDTVTDTQLTIGGVSDTFSSTTRAADTMPEAFSFTDQTGVEPGAVITSDAIAVTGIDSAASITVSDGEYSINGGTFTSTAGTVNHGDNVKVRHTSSASFDTQTDTVLMIGGVSDTFSSTTRAADTMPEAFSFTDQTGVEPGAVITSDAIAVTGIDSAASITVSGGEYSINGGTFTSTAGTVNHGDNVKVRHTSSASFDTQTDTVLMIGGVSDTFSSTTRAADTMPEAFSFTDQTGVEPGAVITSDAIAVTGIDSAASITVSGGEYSINGGTFTSTAGTVNHGDNVKVRHTSSASFDTQTDTVLMIGGASDTFSSTTRAADTMPEAFSFTDQTGVDPGTVITSDAIAVTGIDSAASITVSGGEYSINGGTFTSTAGTVNHGDNVKVRHTSSASFDTQTDTVLMIGGVSDTFSSTTRAADTMPEAFSFTDQTGVNPGTVITSDAIAVAGIDSAASITVSGGEYSINGGTFTSTAGTVNHGDNVKVRHTSSASFDAQTDTVLMIGGASDTFSSTTRAADTMPEAFSFTDQTGVDPGTVITSDAIAVTGIDSAASITVSGGEYSINGGTFTSTAGTVNHGDNVKVRHTSSASFDTQTDTVLMIGGASDTFSSTTKVESVGDSTPPVVTAPASLSKSSKGYNTRFTIADLKQQGSAIDETDGALDIALDSVDGVVPVFRSQKTIVLLRPGRHILVWSATDSTGNKGIANQQVDVLPQATFLVNQSSTEGQTVALDVILNGDAPEYPVTIPFTISGTADAQDYRLNPDVREIVINKPSANEEPTGKIDVTLLEDGVAESNEFIIFTMGESLQNAVAGRKTEHRITILAQNMPPKARIRISQNGINGNPVYQNDGMVTMTANAKDPNGDDLTYQWFSDTLADSNLDADSATFEIDPQLFNTGRHTLTLQVSDGTYTIEKRKRIRIKAGGIITFEATADTDGDGTFDKDEPGDANGNGIPDYQEEAGMDNSWLPIGQDNPMETDPGLAFELGDATQGQGQGVGSLSEAQLKAYIESEGGNYQPDGTGTPTLILDYKIHGLEEIGSTVSVVIGLSEPLPANVAIRKYNANGWHDFVVDANNQLESAISADGNCPSDGSITYQPGLQVGAACLRLSIQDGGPNDTDGLSNGSIEDPVAISAEKTATSTDTTSDDAGSGSSSGGGGSLPPYLILLLVMMSLRQWVSRLRK